MKRSLIYLAVPYSSPDNYTRHNRFHESCRIAAYLFQQGNFVFSPISHTHPIKELSHLEGDWKFWAEYDTRMLSFCDRMVIATLSGWKESVGVKAEMDVARHQNLDISFIDPITLLIRSEP